MSTIDQVEAMVEALKNERANMLETNREHIAKLRSDNAKLRAAGEAMKEALKELRRDIIWVESGTGWDKSGLTIGEIGTIRMAQSRIEEALNKWENLNEN